VTMIHLPPEAVEKILAGEDHLLGGRLHVDPSNNPEVFSLNRFIDQYMELLRIVSGGHWLSVLSYPPSEYEAPGQTFYQHSA
jgi:hypothetical protein